MSTLIADFVSVGPNFPNTFFENAFFGGTAHLTPN